MYVVETCMADDEWHTRDFDVRSDGQSRVRVNTADKLVVAARAQVVAYPLLGRQTTESTSTGFDLESRMENSVCYFAF